MDHEASGGGAQAARLALAAQVCVAALYYLQLLTHTEERVVNGGNADLGAVEYFNELVGSHQAWDKVNSPPNTLPLHTFHSHTTDGQQCFSIGCTVCVCVVCAGAVSECHTTGAGGGWLSGEVQGNDPGPVRS